MRFFHKFASLNYNFLGLVNGVLLNSKKKKKFTSAISYFEKYAYALDDIKIQTTSNIYPNKIWQLWLQGKEQMPPIVKKCHESIKKYYGDRVILLDKNSLKDYIELPDHIEKKYQKGVISHANYSDMIRLSLLAKYGGCWIDSTTYLTDYIPEDILNADFFTFKSAQSEHLKDINTIEQFKIFSNHINKIIDIESPYFISSKSGNILVNAVLNLFFEYWKHENKLVDYLMIDKMFAIAVLSNKECKKCFQTMPKYYLENVLMLQHALFEEYDENLFRNIKELSSIHKLTHKALYRNPYKNSFLNHIFFNENQIKNNKVFSLKNDDDRIHVNLKLLGLSFKLRKFNNLTEKQKYKTITSVHSDIAEYLQKNYIDNFIQNKLPNINVVPKQVLSTDKIIWQYWGQGFDKLPDIVKICYNSVDKYKKDYIVIRLTDETIKDYVDIPDYIYEKFKTNNSFKRAFFSDILRIYLLSAYGGVWIDSTIYLTSEIPNGILDKDFFMFQRDNNDKKNKKYKLDRQYWGFDDLFKVRCLNSFIVAKPNNKIINALKDILTAYWYNEDKFMHYYVFQILFNELMAIDELKNQNSEIISDFLPHLLHFNINSKNSDKLWNYITSQTSIHKLKYYKKAKRNSILYRVLESEVK